MKKTIITLTLLQTINALASEAPSTTWVEGTYWKAPQILEVTKKIEAVDQDLKRSCTNYANSVSIYQNDEVSDALTNRFERYRKQVLLTPMQVLFAARFLISDIAPTTKLEIETEITSTELVNEKAEKLPYYTQYKSITGVYVKDAREFEIEIQDNSFMSFSRKLGLVDSSVKITSDSLGRLLLEVNGRDLACDLINKKAKLKTKLPSYVNLTKSASVEISNFYSFKLSPLIDQALSKPFDSIIVKAARLGFKLGKTLEEENINNDAEANEKQISNLVNILFSSKTLVPTEQIIKVDGKNTINFKSSTPGVPLTLNLGI